MGKLQKTETEPGHPETVFSADVISVDTGNGVVVVATSAPDGTGFTARVDGVQLDANAQDGQVWFYVGRSLRPEPIVELL